jgi:hypothetical protein
MRLTIAGLVLLTGCWGYSSVDNDAGDRRRSHRDNA